MTRCKGIITVLNIPDYVGKGDTIVARTSNGEFWFYGKYESERAAEVAEEIEGYVIEVDDRTPKPWIKIKGGFKCDCGYEVMADDVDDMKFCPCCGQFKGESE